MAERRGQSAGRAAIEHLVTPHPHAPEAQGLSLTAQLDRVASARTGGDPAAILTLAGGLHDVPEFLGNRSPSPTPTPGW